MKAENEVHKTDTVYLRFIIFHAIRSINFISIKFAQENGVSFISKRNYYMMEIYSDIFAQGNFSELKQIAYEN